MFERPASGENAVLVHLNLALAPAQSARVLEEFKSLVHSAGVTPLAVVTGSRHSPEAHYFVGSGKAAEIRDVLQRTDAGLVIVNHSLSPSQERNLERLLQCRVVDRTGLILDIFAQRARSFAGKLQVELAQLRHLSTRLVRGWTHLERQKGGLGLRGPGETQLETDRRLIGRRIHQITHKLERVESSREQGRRQRAKHDVPTVSLVGYTNAGKSSLFNLLTGADVYSADQLFATLDPTLRRLQLDDAAYVVLADTVGFVRDLPHDLVAAFRSTLQETREADLLLHVIDASDPEHDEYIDTVNAVLREIGAEGIPQLEVFNKIDASGQPSVVQERPDGIPNRVWVSAVSGEGIDLLRKQISAALYDDTVQGWLTLRSDQGRLRALLFDLGAVREECSTDDGNTRLAVRLPRRDYRQLCAREGLLPSLQDG